MAAAVVSGAVALAAPAQAASAPFTSRSPFLIRNVLTDMCADLPGTGAGTEGGPVNQWDCRPGSGDNQRWWFLSRNDTGRAFAIMNDRDQMCLDVPGTGAVPAGTPVSEYRCLVGERDNQMFRAIGGRHGFLLRHERTGFCLDVDGVDGEGGRDARLTLWPCDRQDDHIWTIG